MDRTLLLLELLLLMKLGGLVERGEGRNRTKLMGRRWRVLLLLLLYLLLTGFEG